MEQNDILPCAITRWNTRERMALRAFTIASWALAVVATKLTIWEPSHLPVTIFTMDATILEIFWILLIAIQAVYFCYTSITKAQLVAITVLFEVHFIANNLLHTISITLLLKSQYILAEVALIMNFFNLLTMYFGNFTVPKLLHIGVISGPLSWAIVAIYWNGSIMVPQPDSIVTGILGIICTCGILGTGVFYAIEYYDYTITLCLWLLSSAIAVGQYHLVHANNLRQRSIKFIVVFIQCTVAFIVMATLLLITIAMVLAELFRYRPGLNQSRRLNIEKSKSNPECGEK